MRRRWADPRIKFYIGDVRNEQSLKDAMAGVDFVFHAAALKQVPSCEFFPIEAVRTNVLGAENVLNAAIAAGVKRVIVLSTDKAVYPINAMGISKAMMEKLAVAKSRVANGNTVDLLHPIRQRDGQPRFGGAAVHPPDPGRQAPDGHRPAHDAVHDVDRRGRGSGAVGVRARQPRRHLRTEGPRGHNRDVGAGVAASLQGQHADSGDRYTARREALRDAAHPRGDGGCRGHGRATTALPPTTAT